MSQASLSALAPELKIQIFKSLDDFSSVTSLTSTCRSLHDVWKSNARRICDAVLQMIIECPIKAEVLHEAQNSKEHAHLFWSLGTDHGELGSYQQAIKRTRQLLITAHAMSSACKFFEDFSGKVHSPTERLQFIETCYEAMTLVRLSSNGIPEHLVGRWDMQYFQRVRGVVGFLTNGPSEVLRQGMGIASSQAVSNSIASRFNKTAYRIIELDDGLTVVIQTLLESRLSCVSKCSYCSIHGPPAMTEDDTFWKKEQLADMLLLLPEGFRRGYLKQNSTGIDPRTAE